MSVQFMVFQPHGVHPTESIHTSLQSLLCHLVGQEADVSVWVTEALQLVEHPAENYKIDFSLPHPSMSLLWSDALCEWRLS